MTVHVDHLVKHYRVHHKEAGLRGSLRSLFHRQYAQVKAVDGISFNIEQGRLMYDGDLHALVEQIAPYKLLRSTLERPVDRVDLTTLGEVEVVDGLKVTLRIPRDGVKDAAARALSNLPVDSQFLVSLRHIGVYNWGDPILGLGLVAYAFWQLGYAPGAVHVAQFVVLSLAAMVLLYAFNLIVQTTTIWLVNIRRVDTIVMGLLETGRFPVSFYRGWLRVVLTVIIPVAFLTTFPAEALLGRLEWWLVFVSIALAAVFWRFALRFYTGASS